MSDDRLLGELKEFKRATLERLDSIEHEVKMLSRFKWRAAGALSVVACLVEFVHIWKSQ